MNAESREAVFAELRSQGIRAIKVVAADGSKANGEIRGIRKRVLAMSVVITAIAAGVATYLLSQSTEGNEATAFTDTTRRQVIGDSAVIEKGIRTGWSEVFEKEGERFLASFAIPGVPAGLRNTTDEELRQSLTRHILPEESDSLEAKQIKAMVEGMKDEMARFIKAGGSTVAYGKRLVRRQEEELRYYGLVKNELENAAKSKMPRQQLEDLWENRNDKLRQMGIKLVSFPE